MTSLNPDIFTALRIGLGGLTWISVFPWCFPVVELNDCTRLLVCFSLYIIYKVEKMAQNPVYFRQMLYFIVYHILPPSGNTCPSSIRKYLF